jgi:hypothetical protein
MTMNKVVYTLAEPDTNWWPGSQVKPAPFLNIAGARLTDECLGFGFLRRPTSCIHAVVVALSFSKE